MKKEIPESKCPGCGRGVNVATQIDDDTQPGPKPGDVSVCTHCATLMKFDDDLILQPLPKEELIKIGGESAKMLLEMQRRIKEGVLSCDEDSDNQFVTIEDVKMMIQKFKDSITEPPEQIKQWMREQYAEQGEKFFHQLVESAHECTCDHLMKNLKKLPKYQKPEKI